MGSSHDVRWTIFKTAGLKVTDRGSGVSTKYLVTRDMSRDTILTGISAFEPGSSLPLHTHNCRECVVLIEGEGIVEIDGAEHPLQRFDATWVDAGVPHRFLNTGDRPMRIVWIYTSADADRTIVATGRQTRVGTDEDHF